MLPRGPRGLPPIDLPTAGALSLAGHAVAALALVAVIRLASMLTFDRPKTLAPMDPEKPPVEIELPEVGHDSPLLAPTARAEEAPPAVPGGEIVAHPDTSRAGRGGDETVRERALNLANQDDGFTRDPSVLSNLERSQLQRIEAGRDRRSWEDMRSSRDPMELTFVAMGTAGRAEERRRESPLSPGRGLKSADARSVEGADVGGASGEGAPSRRPGSDVLGGPKRVVGLGWVGGSPRGPESAALPNAHARPLVDRADPMVNANDEGRPSDTEDTEQAVESRMQSLMAVSSMGAAKKGEGRGGTGGGGAAGAGGTKKGGSVSSPLGAGGQGPGDVEKMGYLRAVQSKVHPLWAHAFPKWAIAQGLGGTAIVTFVIEADGTVSSAKVSRSSGIAEFDENVRKAILRGAPYGPLPAGLKPRLVWSFPFIATNPAVRPKDKKEGSAER